MSFFWDSTGVPAALGRSVIVAAITLALSMLIGTPAGYAIARYRFRGKNAYQMSIVSTRAFPVVVLSIPLAVFFLQWGIYDTVWAVALMHTALVLPFVVLITSSVLAGVPVDLEEAAQVFGTAGWARSARGHAAGAPRARRRRLVRRADVLQRGVRRLHPHDRAADAARPRPQRAQRLA